MREIRIKLWYAVLLAIGVSILAIGGTLAVSQLLHQQSEAPPPDISHYTADQVIDVIEAYALCPDLTKQSIQVKYLGQGKWRARMKCKWYSKYDGEWRTHSQDCWYFYEDTARLAPCSR